MSKSVVSSVNTHSIVGTMVSDIYYVNSMVVMCNVSGVEVVLL